MKQKLYTTDKESEPDRNSKEWYVNELEHNTCEYLSSCYNILVVVIYLEICLMRVNEGGHSITIVSQMSDSLAATHS